MKKETMFKIGKRILPFAVVLLCPLVPKVFNDVPWWLTYATHFSCAIVGILAYRKNRAEIEKAYDSIKAR